MDDVIIEPLTMYTDMVQFMFLSKTEDLVVYGAFANAYKDKDVSNVLKDTYVKGGGYVNTMQLIERGINGENFGSLMDSLDASYGNDINAKVEALRKMTGLNYTGAARLLNLDRNVSDTVIKNIMSSPENQNNETKYQESVNEIKDAVVRELSTHIEVVTEIVNFAFEIGFSVLGLDFSPIRGPEGNIEYLLHISKNADKNNLVNNEQIIQIAESSHQILSGD